MPTTILDGETFEEARERRFIEEALIDEKIARRVNKELLELAAKAAGIEAVYVNTCWDQCFKVKYETKHTTGWKVWDPLNDDAAAFRLAVKLNLDINPYPKTGEVAVINWGGKEVRHKTFERIGNDPYAATRRAIVRAAAEIGKSA